MGKKYVPHSDMCGCERCALEWERENPQPVYDVVEDPETLDCGCSVWSNCDCAMYDDCDDCDDWED